MIEPAGEAMAKLKFIVLAELALLFCVLVFLFYRTRSQGTLLEGYEVRSTKGVGDNLWKAVGVNVESRRYIDVSGGGEILDDVQAYRSNLLIRNQFDDVDLKVEPIKLNINKSDVMVVLHIQKTGGTTFETYLVRHTNVKPPCHCTKMVSNYKSGQNKLISDSEANRDVCTCLNDKGQDWMINRHATGWVCGVHADFTELTDCVDTWFNSQDNEHRERRYHYVTLIRDPVIRFISEWLHVRRGATWKECRLHCDGRDASLAEVPFCFDHGTWAGVSFEEFINCSSNMAFNRQTRMLANLSLSDCYRLNSTKTQKERDEIMLQSAKQNLMKSFKFFSPLEYIEEGQLLFEQTFLGFSFTRKMTCKKYSAATNYAVLSEKHWDLVVERNLLDIRLYQFAKDLFLQRLARMNIPVQPRNHESKIVPAGLKYSVVTL
ncbi:heparan-sulfate 6-O-sulfotransferase 2 [Biomphalaria glabrata]|nr:heparan-sulfate 6-O-sulfotransferase 2 [Biomphalaria glabrata]